MQWDFCAIERPGNGNSGPVGCGVIQARPRLRFVGTADGLARPARVVTASAVPAPGAGYWKVAPGRYGIAWPDWHQRGFRPRGEADDAWLKQAFDELVGN